VTGRPLRNGFALAAIAIAAAIAYAPSFAVPLQFDDEARLSHNVAMQQGAFLDALRWLGNSRVVPSITLVLNYRLGGFEPLGYHIGNFAVHLLATLGVFTLALSLCRTPRLRDAWPPHRALLLATAASLFFACHPLQTQAVTYIIQRYASMAARSSGSSVPCADASGSPISTLALLAHISPRRFSSPSARSSRRRTPSACPWPFC
jgi:hypothetical protein